MKYAHIVIGAGYGDEGKGLTTDYLSGQHLDDAPIVIRYNGGAQAGHTVVTDNRRHVFSHIGSGVFNHVPTFLSEDFITNPILFNKEYDKLRDFRPLVYVDPKCRVTTPYDMMLNQIIENNRSQRHGSCGVGIYETILRSQSIPLSIRQLAKITPEQFNDLMYDIKEYTLNRLNNLNIELSNSDLEFFIDQNVVDQYIIDVRTFIGTIIITNGILDQMSPFIFEGAQGLLLSERHGQAPHLTPSDPGILTPIKICENYHISQANAIYVTRTYTTRHGAGPLANEKTAFGLGLNITNETNIPNHYQGNFRYATLAIDAISSAINLDFERSLDFDINVTKQLMITCVDQLPTYNGELSIDNRMYLNYIMRQLMINNGFYSVGPTNNDVYKLENF